MFRADGVVTGRELTWTQGSFASHLDQGNVRMGPAYDAGPQ